MNRRQFLAGSAAAMIGSPLAASLSTREPVVDSFEWNGLVLQRIPRTHYAIDSEKLPQHIMLGCWLLSGSNRRIQKFLVEYKEQLVGFERLMANFPGSTAWIQGYFSDPVPGDLWAWVVIQRDDFPLSPTDGKPMRAAPMLAAGAQMGASIRFAYDEGPY